MNSLRKIFLLFLASFSCIIVYSNASEALCVFDNDGRSRIESGENSGTGKVTGAVIDKSNGESIPGATVMLKGSTVGTVTDLDGFFELKNVGAGTHALMVSFVSYEPLEFENVIVQPGQETAVKILLEQRVELLDEVEITARSLRDREAVLLLEQKQATTFISRIGGQELSRKGVGDVATAVTKMVGISMHAGNNNLYIRGLGDRYNSTSINGLPIPSNNPEQKNVALELFTTDIVEFVAVDKVYGSSLFGDFAGGNIDIVSKRPTGDPLLFFATGSNVNSVSVKYGSLPFKDGPSFFGFNTIEAPGTLTEYAFKHNIDAAFMRPIGMNFSLAASNKIKVGGKKVNFFASLKFDNDFSSNEGIALSVNSTGVPTKDLRKQNHTYQTNTTGMINFEIPLSQNSYLNFNSILVNSSSNSHEKYEGTFIDIANYDNGLMLRKNYEKNTVIINQLLGRHQINRRRSINWGLSYNYVSSDNPDRIQNIFVKNGGDEFVFGQNQITDNHRYFHFLRESEIAFNGSMKFNLSKNHNENSSVLTLGITSRYKSRNFNATQFNFRIHAEQRHTQVDPYNIASFFNQANLDLENYFRIETFRGNYQVPFALDPQVYTGIQAIQGGFASLEQRLAPRLTGVFGLRAEYIFQKVRWNTQLDPSDKSDILDIPAVLPSLALRYELGEKQNLRFGASKTYTLPQFKERAMFIYEEVTQVKLGNPNLYQSDNYNMELKWELFPTPAELVSVGLFGKYIANPINEVTISSATNDISFLNTGDWGYVAGIELELRKEFVISENDKLLLGSNISYMLTDQELNSEKIQRETIYRVDFTHDRARFTGASDWLVNADASYLKTWKNGKNRVVATVSFRHVSDKIYAIGTNTRGNIIDRPYDILDFIFQVKLGKLSFGTTVKNVLNPKIESFQQNLCSDVTVLSFKKGIGVGFSLGLDL